MYAAPADPRATFLVALARALHEAGAPAHRLEDAVDRAARALGVPFDCLSQPTSLILGVGTETRVLRVQPREVHLARLVAIEAAGDAVARGELDPVAGLVRLRGILAEPERHGLLAVLVTPGVSSAAAAVFLHGTVQAVLVAAGLGLTVGLLDRAARANPAYGRVHVLVAAFVVAAAATAMARLVPVAVPAVTLAGIISLLPGLTVTVALTELATGHLASGTARAMGAGVTFLMLGLGTSLGWELAELLPPALRGRVPPLPDYAAGIALPIACAAFTVAFRARRRDYPAILVVSALGYGAAVQGQAWLGAELGASVGGLVIGLASNLQARLRRVPTAVTQVPGLLLLVPGSVGFAGFGAMLEDDLERGIGALVSMLFIAGSLVAGILAAGVLLPPRRGG